MTTQVKEFCQENNINYSWLTPDNIQALQALLSAKVPEEIIISSARTFSEAGKPKSKAKTRTNAPSKLGKYKKEFYDLLPELVMSLVSESEKDRYVQFLTPFYKTPKLLTDLNDQLMGKSSDKYMVVDESFSTPKDWLLEESNADPLEVELYIEFVLLRLMPSLAVLDVLWNDTIMSKLTYDPKTRKVINSETKQVTETIKLGKHEIQTLKFVRSYEKFKDFCLSIKQDQALDDLNRLDVIQSTIGFFMNRQKSSWSEQLLGTGYEYNYKLESSGGSDKKKHSKSGKYIGERLTDVEPSLVGKVIDPALPKDQENTTTEATIEYVNNGELTQFSKLKIGDLFCLKGSNYEKTAKTEATDLDTNESLPVNVNTKVQPMKISE